MASGVIYILINPAFKDLLKIGKTTRTAEERAAEISSGTGIPSKFVVAYEDFVADCDLAERQIFKTLEKYRYETNHEFFALKLKEAIPIVMQTVGQVNAEVERRKRIEEQLREEQLKIEALTRASEIKERRRAEERLRAEEQKKAKERLEAEAQLRRSAEVAEQRRIEERFRPKGWLDAEAQVRARSAQSEAQRKAEEHIRLRAQVSVKRNTEDERETKVSPDEDDIQSGFLTPALPVSERSGKAA